jgi:UDP-N-acetylmuramate dehydrogenase
MSLKENLPSLFLKTLGKTVKESVPLRDHSNFRLGGEADHFFQAKTLEELEKAVHIARKCSVSYYVIGAGCNLLFDDEGFRGLIIKNEAKGIKLKKEKSEVEALSGTPLDELVYFCLEKGLTGFEFLAGIPGTVGGAVFSNSGAFGGSIGDFLEEALLLGERGKRVRVNKDYFVFGYRESYLKRKHNLLLKAVFVLQPGDKARIEETIEMNLQKRERKHPPQSSAYAGSYFKNPVFPDGKKVAAAYLLDKVGAKGLRFGGAAVYDLHSNFIINQENASCEDVRTLAQELKQRVREKFGVELEEEIIYLPATSSMP